jgi:hypothetical protein
MRASFTNLKLTPYGVRFSISETPFLFSLRFVR